MSINVKICAIIPAKEISSFIELIESVNGKVEELETVKEKTSLRRSKVFVTRKKIQEVLTLKNKHPNYTNSYLAELTGIGQTNIGTILAGKHPLQKRDGENASRPLTGSKKK